MTNIIIFKNSNDIILRLEVGGRKTNGRKMGRAWGEKMGEGMRQGGDGEDPKRECDNRKKKIFGVYTLFTISNVLHGNNKRTSIIFNYSNVSPNTNFMYYL